MDIVSIATISASYEGTVWWMTNMKIKLRRSETVQKRIMYIKREQYKKKGIDSEKIRDIVKMKLTVDKTLKGIQTHIHMQSRCWGKNGTVR